MMRASGRAVLLGLAILILAGCEDWDFDSARYHEDFHFTYALDPGANVEVENFNGEVEIDGWDQNNVEISGAKFANTEERLKEMRIDIEHSPGSVSIRTAPPLDRHSNCGARYVIRLPRRAELSRIVSSNGAIRVDGITGSAHLRTSNGSIQASSITGDESLQTSNGAIHVDGGKGGLEAVTSNGSITARLDSGSNLVRLHSTNGHIDLTMDAPREVRAETSNGAITVRMPESAGASVRVHTSNASISSDFDITAHGVISKHRLEGTIGPGGPLLDLETSNGPIKLIRL